MAVPITVNLFRDTLELVQRYNSSLAFKSSFERLLNNPRATYLNRPLKDYVTVMTQVTPEYKGIFQQGLTKEHITDLIQDFYFNKHGFPVLNKEYLDLKNGVIEQPAFLTEPEHEELVKKEEELEKAKKRDKVGGATSKEGSAVSGQSSGVGSGTGATSKDGLAVSGMNSGTGSGTAATNKKFQTRLISKVPYPVTNFLSNVISSASINFVKFRAEHDVMDKTIISGAVVGGITSLLTGSPTIGAIAGIGTGTVVNIAATNQKNAQNESRALEEIGGDSNNDTGSGSSNNSSSGGGLGGRPNLNLQNRVARRLAGNLGRNLSRQVASAATKRGFMLLLANPEFWLPILMIIIIILALFFLLNQQLALFPPWQKPPTTTATGSLTITKTGPAEVGNGQDITYEISVTYIGIGKANIQLTDKIDEKTTFKSASNGGTEVSKQVTWSLTGLSTGQSQKLSLVVTPTKNDIWVVNSGATGTITSVTGIGGGSIAACQFTRSGQLKSVGSSKLISYFEDISAKSGIPASMLASVVMHESQDFATNAKDDHDAFGTDIVTDIGCKHFATSRTGALGLMQIQPPQFVLPIARADAHDKVGVERGLHFIDPSRSYESLTMRDFCDVKTSIAMAAGILINKNGGKIPTTPEEVEVAGCGYFGSPCTYGEFNYGQEIRKDYEACLVTGAPGGDTSVTGTPTTCDGAVVSFNVAKKLLPLPNENSCSSTVTQSCGRPGTCVFPRKIVLHTTVSPVDAEGIYQYFAGGAGGRGVGSHFVIGKDGKVIQMVETLADKVEIAYAVANYSDHISIEMAHTGLYESKAEVPAPQYQATLDLVKQLMQQYKIPLGSLEYDWKNSTDTVNGAALPGLYGHYQLNPSNRTDPGAGLVRDIRADLKANSTPTALAATTTVSNPVDQKTFNIGNTNLKRIAITFDYGQGSFGRGEKLKSEDYAVMNQILDILQRTGARATVFPTGTFYADPANQGILQKMKSLGLEFANHTYDHNSADNWSAQDFIDQLQKTENAAQNIARVGTTKPYFRYPFLADSKYLDVLASQGYYYIRMTCDGGDWREGATAPYVLARLNSRECKQNGSIIIVHGYTTQTAGALEEAIKEYQAEGYEVTTVSRVLEGLIK